MVFISHVAVRIARNGSFPRDRRSPSLKGHAIALLRMPSRYFDAVGDVRPGFSKARANLARL